MQLSQNENPPWCDRAFHVPSPCNAFETQVRFPHANATLSPRASPTHLCPVQSCRSVNPCCAAADAECRSTSAAAFLIVPGFGSTVAVCVARLVMRQQWGLHSSSALPHLRPPLVPFPLQSAEPSRTPARDAPLRARRAEFQSTAPTCLPSNPLEFRNTDIQSCLLLAR